MNKTANRPTLTRLAHSVLWRTRLTVGLVLGVALAMVLLGSACALPMAGGEPSPTPTIEEELPPPEIQMPDDLEEQITLELGEPLVIDFEVEAEAGLKEVTVEANKEVIFTAEGEGDTSKTINFEWTPEEAKTYLMSVHAVDEDDQEADRISFQVIVIEPTATVTPVPSETPTPEATVTPTRIFITYTPTATRIQCPPGEFFDPAMNRCRR